MIWFVVPASKVAPVFIIDKHIEFSVEMVQHNWWLYTNS